MKPFGSASRLAVLGMLAVPPAFAAPFCVRNEALPSQCIYYDAQECQKEAIRYNGVCSSNPAELKLVRGYGRYCVVTSGHVSVCQYMDRTSCDRAASQQQGACTEAPASQPGAGAPDPYSQANGD
jgi:hypothetical protein